MKTRSQQISYRIILQDKQGTSRLQSLLIIQYHSVLDWLNHLVIQYNYCMKKGQAREYFEQLKKIDKAKHTPLPQVISIITAGTIPPTQTHKFIEQTATNQFGTYNEIYDLLQLPDWRQLDFDQIYLIIKCLKDYIKKSKTQAEAKDNSVIDIKQQIGSQFESRLQSNSLQLLVNQFDHKESLINTEQSSQSAYNQKWKHAKFKVVKKLLIVFDFFRKSMRIEGQSFQKNQKICEKLDLNMFMKYAKTFQLASAFKTQKVIKSFREKAINLLWVDFDRFVSTNLQIVGFRQTLSNKEKYLRLKALLDLLSSQKIKKMLNIRGRKALATIVEGHTGTYKQDILDYLKRKYEERKVKLDSKWKNKKINTEADQSRISTFQQNLSKNMPKIQSTKVLTKRSKTQQAVSIYEQLRLPKLRLKQSREQSIYKSLKQLSFKSEQLRVRQLINVEQDEQFLKEYLRKQQVQKQQSKRRVAKLVELSPMKFT